MMILISIVHRQNNNGSLVASNEMQCRWYIIFRHFYIYLDNVCVCHSSFEVLKRLPLLFLLCGWWGDIAVTSSIKGIIISLSVALIIAITNIHHHHCRVGVLVPVHIVDLHCLAMRAQSKWQQWPSLQNMSSCMELWDQMKSFRMSLGENRSTIRRGERPPW